MCEAKKQFRTFHLDGDVLKTPVRLDELTGKYFLDCPDLEETPIYTQSGFLWVNAVQDTCPFHDAAQSDGGTYHDCGSCRFFESELSGDIIGICRCEALRRKTNSNADIIGGKI
ncbi:MAG: hypothetical protein RSC43_09135 [Clostridia bacterium]